MCVWLCGCTCVFVWGCIHVYVIALELPEIDVGFPLFRQEQPWLSLNSLCSTCQARTPGGLKACGIMAGWHVFDFFFSPLFYILSFKSWTPHLNKSSQLDLLSSPFEHWIEAGQGFCAHPACILWMLEILTLSLCLQAISPALGN